MNFSKGNKTGFTLIEMLITMSIVTIISSVILFNYSSFNDKLALTSASQEMSLVIRKAENDAINVKESTVSAGTFSHSYAVYFDINNPSYYYLFVDKDVDGRYDVGNGCGSNNTECVEEIFMKNGVKITNICDSTTCPPTNATRLYIGFLRPSLDATIYFVDNANGYLSTVNTGKIMLVSPKGQTSTVVIEKTGQISIQ